MSRVGPGHPDPIRGPRPMIRPMKGPGFFSFWPKYIWLIGLLKKSGTKIVGIR